MSDQTEAEKRIEEIAARRKARKTALSSEQVNQEAVDLDALDAAEVKHGDNCVSAIRVPYVQAGRPTMLIVRVPKPLEMKKYRATVKPKKGQEMGDVVGGAEDLGTVCMVYPESGEVRQDLLQSRPGLLVQAGIAALALAGGKAEEEAKS